MGAQFVHSTLALAIGDKGGVGPRGYWVPCVDTTWDIHMYFWQSMQFPSIRTMYKRIHFMNEEKLVIGVEWPVNVIVDSRYLVCLVCPFHRSLSVLSCQAICLQGPVSGVWEFVPGSAIIRVLYFCLGQVRPQATRGPWPGLNNEAEDRPRPQPSSLGYLHSVTCGSLPVGY